MAEPTARQRPRTLPTWLTERDWGLLLLLLVLNIRSAYTTVIGSRQLMPYPMADIFGISIQTMLFLVLAGFALKEAVVRKWTVVVVFATICIYASFFSYYDELAGTADAQEQLDSALITHATFVSAIYQPARSRIDTLAREAEALF